MSSDDAVPAVRSPVPIRTPDQLQQARRPDEARPAKPAASRPGVEDRRPPDGGVLGQLRTERAHD